MWFFKNLIYHGEHLQDLLSVYVPWNSWDVWNKTKWLYRHGFIINTYRIIVSKLNTAECVLHKIYKQFRNFKPNDETMDSAESQLNDNELWSAGFSERRTAVNQRCIAIVYRHKSMALRKLDSHKVNQQQKGHKLC